MLSDGNHTYVNIHNEKSILKIIHECHQYSNAASRDIYETSGRPEKVDCKHFSHQEELQEAHQDASSKTLIKLKHKNIYLALTSACPCGKYM